jgi:preprotein translocase subunit SecA
LTGDAVAVKNILDDILIKATPDEVALIENKKKEFGADTDGGEAFLRTARGVMLQSIDLFWVDHLELMDYMRSSVNLRAYGQRDPLVEYKREGLRLFKEMEQSVDHEIIRILTQVQGQVDTGSTNQVIELKQTADGLAGGFVGAVPSDVSQVSVSGSDKIGRNDPCPCGSGKKYKKCHGK